MVIRLAVLVGSKFIAAISNNMHANLNLFTHIPILFDHFLGVFSEHHHHLVMCLSVVQLTSVIKY